VNCRDKGLRNGEKKFPEVPSKPYLSCFSCGWSSKEFLEIGARAKRLVSGAFHNCDPHFIVIFDGAEYFIEVIAHLNAIGVESVRAIERHICYVFFFLVEYSFESIHGILLFIIPLLSLK
jgi:hypothetical protein